MISLKLVDGTWKVKARLVARGFEEDVDQIRSDSPTCLKERLQILLLVASIMNWKLVSIDIKCGFLQEYPIQRVLFVRPPKEAGAIRCVWKLNEVVYGLSDASRAWYLKVVDELPKLGGRVSASDKVLFLRHQSNRLIGMLTAHVGDFVGCGTTAFGSNIIEAIKI